MTEDANHLTIGEVLALVRDEFPDVTISKIRFLESQGLIDPQRTPSGYRKFFDDDVASLRWVLRQQRDNFLPLKVIKAKLAGADVGDDPGGQQNLWSDGSTAPPEPPAPASPEPRSESRSESPASPPTPAPDESSVDASPDPAAAAGAWLSELQEAPPRVERSRTAAPKAGGTVDDVAPGLRFGRDEVLDVTGVTAAALDQMIEYGLVQPIRVGGEELFDPTAVAVVRAVALFEARGLEARHLRPFKNGAEREAGLIEQMILPLLKQRNPTARDRAVEQLDQLRSTADDLHRALIDQALRSHSA
jgi:DNA-binding transcriptional MerR regulator